MSDDQRPCGPPRPVSLHDAVLRRRPNLLAKNLLRDLIAGRPEATAEFERFHPRFDEIREQPKLAHAQHVIACKLGYRSWAELKRQRDLIVRYSREVEQGAPAPDRDAGTAHVRCGSDIQDRLTTAGFTGAFVEFSDPLCQGPVCGDGRAALIESRSAFVAQAYELDPASARERMQRQWRHLDGLTEFERVVLWFEHDAYDQLLLACILAHLSPHKHPRVELICVDRYPGAQRFRGLGDLPPWALRGLWDERRRVESADYELGREVWAALCLCNPTRLWELARCGTSAIPPMGPALRRHLMELPWTSDGLSLTQRATLELAASRPIAAGALFRGLMAVEPLPFLGDTMFWWEVRELAAGGALRLRPTGESWRHWDVELTDSGRALLAGHADWVEEGQRPRWVGGVPCGPPDGRWRWDPTLRRPRPYPSGNR